MEASVRAMVNEYDTGRLPANKLIVIANDAIKYLAKRVIKPESRIAIQLNAGNATIAEEDWPGTEIVGVPTYATGLQGAFYIRYALFIKNIFPILNTGTDAAPVWDTRAPMLNPARQEHFNEYNVFDSEYIFDWAPYPYTIVSSIGTLTAPTKVIAIWLRNQPDFSGADDFYRYEIQYVRWGPIIDVSYESGVYTYTQPYFFYFDDDKELLVREIAKRAHYMLKEGRYTAASFEERAAERLSRIESGARFNLDTLPVIQQVEEPLRDNGPEL